MTAPVMFSHLLHADDALAPGRWGDHVTLCGLELQGPSVTTVDGEIRDVEWMLDDDTPDFRTCQSCVQAACNRTSNVVVLVIRYLINRARYAYQVHYLPLRRAARRGAR